MHIARAAAARALRLGVITTAGPETQAKAGLAEVRQVSLFLDAAPYDVTTTFRHLESAAGRRLWLERRGGTVAVGRADHDRIGTRGVLFAPVAREIATDALRVWDDAWSRGAILQGWLRSTAEGVEVTPLPLSSLAPPLLEALGQLDVLVASRADLVAEAVAPGDQLAALRECDAGRGRGARGSKGRLAGCG